MGILKLIEILECSCKVSVLLAKRDTYIGMGRIKFLF